MKSEDIARVITLMEQHGIAVFELETEQAHLRLARDAARVSTPIEPISGDDHRPATRDDPAHIISSPSVGWFVCAHPGICDAAPALPRSVVAGDIVAYIRTGAMLRPVLAPRAGTLGKQRVADGAPVGFGEPLFALSP